MRRSRFEVASQRNLPIGSPLWLWAYHLLPDLALTSQARSGHRPNRVHFVPQFKEELCYGLVVPFPLLSTMCCHTAVKVPYPAVISQTSGERTFTALNAHLLRRTMPLSWSFQIV